MIQEQVLALLKASGTDYLSGQDISRRLGISRAAVWKAVEALRQDGYRIDSLTRRGYRLAGGPDVLRPGELTGQLKDCLVGRELVCLDETDSTNTELKRRALAGAAEGLALIARKQTGGRGRQGRSFLSPEGGLYLSILLRPPLDPTRAVDLTAWAAVAVCDGVEEACGVRPQIKWPNDILLSGKKLCGILTEMEVEGETGALQWVIVGIGTNIDLDPQVLPPEAAAAATSLAREGLSVRRSDLAVCQLRALDRMYRDFLAGNRARWLARYRADCATLGRQAVLLRRGTQEEVFAQEVDDQFRLVVRHADGSLEAVSSGEVSVRGLLGYA